MLVHRAILPSSIAVMINKCCSCTSLALATAAPDAVPSKLCRPDRGRRTAAPGLGDVAAKQHEQDGGGVDMEDNDDGDVCRLGGRKSEAVQRVIEMNTI